jgi:putative ATPase
MKRLGYGKGYEYAHDLPEGRSDQEHLPPNLAGRIYYEPTGRGFEAEARERLAWREKRRLQTPPTPPPVSEPAPGEESQLPPDELAPGEEPQLPPAASASRRREKRGKV